MLDKCAIGRADDVGLPRAMQVPRHHCASLGTEIGNPSFVIDKGLRKLGAD